MTFLSISRWLVSIFTSLHLSSLKLGIKRMEAKAESAIRSMDVAHVAHVAAQDTVKLAKAALFAAEDFADAAHDDLNRFIGAAKAEADTLRSNHTVGA